MNSELNPKSPEYLTSLADAYLANKETEKAKVTYQKALEVAKEHQTRQWYINQLQLNLLKAK
jgi:hypothetical protein